MQPAPQHRRYLVTVAPVQPNISRSALRDFFHRFEPLEWQVICRPPRGREPPAAIWCGVAFSVEQEAQRAIAELNDRVWCGTKVRVRIGTDRDWSAFDSTVYQQRAQDMQPQASTYPPMGDGSSSSLFPTGWQPQQQLPPQQPSYSPFEPQPQPSGVPPSYPGYQPIPCEPILSPRQSEHMKYKSVR